MFYGPFLQTPYNHHPLLQPGNIQDPDFQYAPGSDYPHEKSFENGQPLNVESYDRDIRAFGVPQQRVPSSFHNVAINSRKRKASSVDEFDNVPDQKKATLAQVQVQDPNGDYYDLSGQTSPYSPFVPTPTGSTGFPACPPRGTSPRPSGHHYSTSTASQVSLAAPSPHTPAFSPSFTTVKSEQSPGVPMTPVPRPTSTSSPLKSSIPKLVRTSTIQTSPPPGVFSNLVPGHAQNFNPYAMHPLKATLKLKGDIDTMKENWTAEEKEARRRLVEFKRSQVNSTITAEFNAVAPQDRQPSSICISCIWWKEKNEFYVTSVDTIYLLEALVGVRFTVEEKNRIRRNLEGFRPMTISKAKADSEEFFKVIMGFPHPKPRNIEKDVKVFPWKILSTALKKIISKYSASYSSTAASLLTPTASIYSRGEGMLEYHHPQSPHPEYFNGTSAPYQVHPGMAYMQGPVHMRMPVSVAPAPVPELQLQMPECVPTYDLHGQYCYQSMPQLPQGTMGMAPHPMTAPVARMAPWEYANFVNDSPVTMAPQSAPPVAYPRGTMETAEFIPTMH
ncbi:hypothetical protein A1O3_02054 [Capronia epimyces CBS 606.96]|uniref:DUF7082 domain-containing protein n=1 Tax=Capronia epimyces CBS 606.96 TaxID=1182542 RepID=W9YH57_9EURO|nr:uncharacterized protein A1O3_02054 [Capronia epimyces CBS 606.96]EXJ88990.1 hypothetical protein A1O3_02054 [Capronia epimyces CBS 606.96]